MRVLMVSGDARIAGQLSSAFVEQGQQFVVEPRYRSALPANNYDVDLILFDLGEARTKDWDELRHWLCASDLPFIVIGSAAHDTNEAVRTLRLGCEDYVGRPLYPSELVARSEALLRRLQMTKGLPNGQAHWRQAITLDRRSRSVRIQGRRVELTPTEFRLFDSLVEKEGETVTRSEIVASVWGKDRRMSEASLNLYVWNLRQKLEDDPARPKMIITRWGVGYAYKRPSF